MREHRYRVGCDIGGTFTDFVLLDETTGEISIDKKLTTPKDPSVGMLDGLMGLAQKNPGYVRLTRRVAHATTLVANAVIERKGARLALLCTKGFRDIIEVRRHVRVTTYELWVDPPEPLVPRHLRVPVTERTYSDGRVLIPVDPEEIRAIAVALRKENVQSVAVAFLHSYVNPANEREVARLLAEYAPEIAVTTSAEVLPQIKEFERTSTAVVNAYVKPLTRTYLRRLNGGLAKGGFKAPLHIMLSNGGIASTETAGEFPIRLIESGPVAGAIVGRHYAELMKLENLLTFDMGGTTAKACLIRDRALPMTDELEVARSKRFTKSSGYPVAVPAVNLIEIGAGGGSIAAVNSLGVVQVGPESAGADPGPVCYGRGGTRPTVTDADLLLGYLNADYFAGGSMRLDKESAQRAVLETIGGPKKCDLITAAWTVHDVINETMTAAVRMHVTERGGDPGKATLVAFGGAGPVHVYNLACKLGIKRILVPLRPGVLSAVGLLIAPPAFDIVRTHKTHLEKIDARDIEKQFREMAADVERMLREVEPRGRIIYSRAVDVGYAGQGYQVPVALAAGARGLDRRKIFASFAAIYREKYGYFYDDVPAEVVNLRLKGEVAGGQLTLKPLKAARGGTGRAGKRPAYSAIRGKMIPFAVVDRADLAPGMRFRGPAVVEEASCTTVIDVGGRVAVDRFGSLVITVK